MSALVDCSDVVSTDLVISGLRFGAEPSDASTDPRPHLLEVLRHDRTVGSVLHEQQCSVWNASPVEIRTDKKLVMDLCGKHGLWSGHG